MLTKGKVRSRCTFVWWTLLNQITWNDCVSFVSFRTPNVVLKDLPTIRLLSHSDVSAYRICIDIDVGAHYVISASTPRRIGLAETMKRSLAPALHQYISAMRRAPSIRQDRTGQDTAEQSEQATRAGAGDLQLSDSVCRDHWRVGVTCRPVWVTCRRERREVSFGGTWDENRFV